jgi:DNA polymerase alpha subunit A
MRADRREVLKKLKEARSEGVKRSEQFVVSEEKAAITEYNDEEYSRLVADNKNKQFIVDDYGLGYDDEGELEWKDEGEENLEEEDQVKRPMTTRQISNYLKPAKPKAAPKTAEPKAEVDIDKLLLSLENGDTGVDDLVNFAINKPKPATVAPNKNLSLSASMKQCRSKFQEIYSKPPPSVAVNPPPPCKEEEEEGTPAALKKRLRYDENPPMELEVEAQPVKEELVEEVTEFLPYEPLELPQFENDIAGARSQLTFEEDGDLLVYWIDAYEEKELLPGGVFIFGKVRAANQWASVCIPVQEIKRTLYFLPKPGRGAMEVYSEVEQLRQRYGISRWECKPVKRNYAFDQAEVPRQVTEYLKVEYSGRYPVLPIKFGSSFSHVFGGDLSLVDRFLLKAKLMGPCWIRVKTPLIPQRKFSVCRFELTVDGPNMIATGDKELTMPAPPLSVLSLSAVFWRNSKNLAEIVSVAGSFLQSVSCDAPTVVQERDMKTFCLVRKLDSLPDQARHNRLFEAFDNESSMLNAFMAKVAASDPDVIVAHELCGELLELLAARLNFLRIQGWSKLGRLSRSRWPSSRKDENFSGNWQQRAWSSGRLMCDTFLSCKELLKESNYTLEHLTKTVLKKTRTDLETDDLLVYLRSAPSWAKLANHVVQDSRYSLQLCLTLSVLPLTKQLTNIAGNLWIRSLMNARAERNEMLLMHEFTKKKYVCPSKAEKSAKQETYSGGLVLEPKAGLYEHYVLLLDFNSLYPSIIQEFNICFTTIPTLTGDAETPPSGLQPGVLPEVLKRLVQWRRTVKQNLAQERDPVRRQQLDIKQQALKLTANSIYGCLGFKNCRFYAKPLAALITRLGREILEKTAKIAREELRMDVIYGDTDSIMVNSQTNDLAAAKESAERLKQRVNKQYRCLEIELDFVFKSMLLLKKKKYAALRLDGSNLKREVKGLDMVRRDWCELSKTVSSDLLDLILSNKSREDVVTGIHEVLLKVYDDATNNRISLGQYVITRQLTKAPDAYTDNQPHVRVAKKLMQQGHTNLVKHFIPYVICRGEAAAAERSYHPDDVASSAGALNVDVHWYLTQQILPPVLRLCSVIEGTDAGQLAHCLGQDPKKYTTEEAVTTPQVQTVDRFVTDFKVECECGGHTELAERPTACSTCRRPFSVVLISNSVSNMLREASLKYSEGSLACNEPECKAKTRCFDLKKCPVPGCRGKLAPEYSVERLHDVMRFARDCYEAPEYKKVCQAIALTHLRQSGYQKVSLKSFTSHELSRQELGYLLN